MRRSRAIGALGALALAAGTAVVAPVAPEAFAAPVAVRCRAVSGALSVSPGLRTAPARQTIQLDTFHASRCGAAPATATADISGSLESTSASCSLAASEQFHGLLTIDWSDGSSSFIKTARLKTANNADDPLEVRLDGVVTGGTDTGSILRVALHLDPTQGDCDSGITGLSAANVGALRIGGPYPTCQTVTGAASITPGLTTTAAAQTIHLSGFQLAQCRSIGTARGASIIGALNSDTASCPLGRDDRFHGTLEIDWDNHFVSIVGNAGIASTHNPNDPFEVRLQGVVKKGVDTGTTFRVVLHLTPTQGDCTTGVTGVSIANVGTATFS